MTAATVCLCYDFDVVSVWFHGYGVTDSPTKTSRGLFGAEVAAPRILELHDRLDVPSTWFTPGHTIDSFPEICGEVVDRGHDIQHHGWSHTDPRSFESAEAERADVERGIESVRDLTGERPTGYRSPAWDFSDHTLDILLDLGFEWDSSLMGGDFRPYYARRLRTEDAWEPYDVGETTDLLEFPVSWHRDDWPALQYVPDSTPHVPNADEERVFDMWYSQFEWMYDAVEDGVYTLTMHPQVIGQAPRLRHLERLVRRMQEKADVEFGTLDAVAAEM